MFFQSSSSLNQNPSQISNNPVASLSAQFNTPSFSTVNQPSQSVVSAVAAAVANPGIDLIVIFDSKANYA